MPTLGLVSGDAILGANVFKDLFAGIRDIVGGRSAAYEQELQRAKTIALEEMEAEAAAIGGNAIVGSTSTTRPSARRRHADGDRERHGRHDGLISAARVG